MKHIPIIRLVKLAANPAIGDSEDSAHLRECQHCQIIVRQFVEDFKKQAMGNPDEVKEHRG